MFKYPSISISLFLGGVSSHQDVLPLFTTASFWRLFWRYWILIDSLMNKPYFLCGVYSFWGSFQFLQSFLYIHGQKHLSCPTRSLVFFMGTPVNSYLCMLSYSCECLLESGAFFRAWGRFQMMDLGYSQGMINPFGPGDQFGSPWIFRTLSLGILNLLVFFGFTQILSSLRVD